MNPLTALQELYSLPNWVNWIPRARANGGTDKHPKPDVNKPELHMTYEQASSRDKYAGRIGFCPKANDQIVIMDVDHIHDLSLLPQPLYEWIQTANPTIETSPGGDGLHIYAKLPSDISKADLSATGKLFVNKEFAEIRDGRPYGLEYMALHGTYMTVTQNIMQGHGVPEIPREVLKAVFATKDSASNIIDIADKLPINTSNKLSIKNLEDMLTLIPCSPDSERLQRAYEEINQGAPFSYYNFWLDIGMACRHFQHTNGFEMMRVFSVWDVWSSQDPNSYSDTDTLAKKFMSFKVDVPNPKTIATIKLYYEKMRFDWPYPKKKGIGPLPNMQENFKYLMSRYNIKGYRDELNNYAYFISGDSDIMNAYFAHYKCDWVSTDIPMYGPIDQPNLEVAVTLFAQANQYTNVEPKTIIAKLKAWQVQQGREHSFNVFKRFIRLPQEEISPLLLKSPQKKHTFDDVFKCITFQEQYLEHEELFYICLKKWFFLMMKNHFYDGEFDTDNSVLLLTGPENCRKSTFVKCLMPRLLSDMYFNCAVMGLSKTGDLNDAAKLANRSVILEWSEGDRVLDDKYDSTIKSFITTREHTMRDLYASGISSFRKMAVYTMTTNKRELKFGRDGVRRFWVLPVEFMDTSTLVNLNLHSVYHSLYEEYCELLEKGDLPWCLTEEEIERMYKMISGDFSTENSLDIHLRDIFDWEDTKGIDDLAACSNIRDYRYAYTITQAKRVIANKLMADNVRFHITGLKHSLRQLCSEYTGTRTRNRKLGKHMVYDGYVSYNKSKHYILPPFNESDNPAEII